MSTPASSTTRTNNHLNNMKTMETKHRTILQAAVMILALAVLVLHHNVEKNEQAMAQQSIHARR